MSAQTFIFGSSVASVYLVAGIFNLIYSFIFFTAKDYLSGGFALFGGFCGCFAALGIILGLKH
jgi:tryptophan-rich sensory protein